MLGSGWLATFLLFCAWLLQLFTIIGGLDNLPFLNEAYFTRVQSNNQANRFYLWNECSEDPLGTVNQCSHPVAGYEWASLPPYNTVSGITGHSKTFYALSAVTWIAFGITTLVLLSSLITHCCCCKRMTSRWFDFNHFWWTFIAWLAQLAAFILAIVFGTRGGQLLENGLSNTTYSLGPNTWMSLGAFLALTLASMMFCCGFCIARKKRNNPAVDPTYDNQPQYAQTNKESRGWFGRKKQTPVQDPEMAYNSTGAYNSGAYDTAGAAGAGTYGTTRAAGNDANAYNAGSGAYGNSAYDSNPHTGAKAAAAGAAGVAAGAYGASKYNQSSSTGTTGAYGAGTNAAGTGSYGNPQTTTGGVYNNDAGVDNDSSVYHTPATGYEQGTNPNGTAYKSGTGAYDTAADGYNNLTGYDNNIGANATSNSVRV